MKVRIRLAGPLRLPPEGREVDWEGKKGITAGTVLTRALGYSPRELGFVQIFSGGKSLRPDDRLEGDCELLVMLRLGGG